MQWIDVQDQLPKDGVEVWVCVLASYPSNGEYLQNIGKFYRANGWKTAISFDPCNLGGMQIHYWCPKPTDPPKPQWYLESVHDV